VSHFNSKLFLIFHVFVLDGYSLTLPDGNSVKEVNDITLYVTATEIRPTRFHPLVSFSGSSHTGRASFQKMPDQIKFRQSSDQTKFRQVFLSPLTFNHFYKLSLNVKGMMSTIKNNLG